MSLEHLETTLEEYINMLKSRGITVKSNISNDRLLKKVKYLRKNDFRHLAATRNIPITTEMNVKQLINAIYQPIYPRHQREKQQVIKNMLLVSNLPKLTNRQNISKSDAEEIIKLNSYTDNTLKKIAKLRHMQGYTNLLREELIYTLLRSEKSLYENKYLQNNTSDVIKEKISDIRTELAKYGDIITGKERDAIRNELFEIENKTRLTRKEKNNIIKRLNDISLYIDNKRKYEQIERDDFNYYGISDLEHMHGNIDDYYIPVLPRQSFDGNYEFYTSRGDKNK